MRKNKLIDLICLLVFTLVLLSACSNYSSNNNQSDNTSSINSNDDISKASSESTKSENSKQEEDSGKRKLRFQGKSDNWRVEYIALTKLTELTNGRPIGNQTDILELQYIGGQPPTKFNYSIKSPAGDSTAKDVTLKDGYMKENTGGCEKCIILTENDVMRMIIKWNGESEIIRLETQ